MIGARPRESSSIRSSFGCRINAFDNPTIYYSPPKKFTTKKTQHS